ncbi:hypothetical protein EDC96DRAFT_161590 [Choanephora cucurbitarum]|nr:hypothetical protein EDC96DRAFT_161590 [Choanephora cucurbitarum]
MVFLYNKIAEWKDEDEDDDDDDEETQRKDKKRKRTEAPSENDMMMVVKFVLDAVFADTGLKWRSGEKTSSATKRSKIVNELASSSNINNANTSNIMGRRRDLTLRNKRGVDVCLVEFKNGSSLGDEIAQDSKSLRCTKSLRAYNSTLSNKLMWSMNWSGKVIHETTMIH